MEDIERLTYLIELHLADNNEKNINKNHMWCIKKSNLSGVGVFANRDIKVGEVIYCVKPLLIGPTGRKDTISNICIICYKLLDENNCICKNGCTLPVCKECSDGEEHLRECNLYKKWKPIIDYNQGENTINLNTLRLITIARSLFLDDNQKQLLFAMQANDDPLHKNEINKAIKCFLEFPNDPQIIEDFNHVVSVLNTNAFETLYSKKSYELPLRALYPLAGTMNHECTPNTCHEFDENNMMIVKACKFIPKDTEITTTYTKLLWNNMSRRLFLTVTKGFTCICERCFDPTENGTYLNSILCRKNGCCGYIVADDCFEKSWTCLKCNEKYDTNYIIKIQQFSLNAVNSKITSSSIKELIEFINNKLIKICPPTNQLALETKLNVIWKMNKTNEEFTKDDYQSKINYCEEVIKTLEKLNAGECTLKKLLTREIEDTKILAGI